MTRQSERTEKSQEGKQLVSMIGSGEALTETGQAAVEIVAGAAAAAASSCAPSEENMSSASPSLVRQKPQAADFGTWEDMSAWRWKAAIRARFGKAQCWHSETGMSACAQHPRRL